MEKVVLLPGNKTFQNFVDTNLSQSRRKDIFLVVTSIFHKIQIVEYFSEISLKKKMGEPASSRGCHFYPTLERRSTIIFPHDISLPLLLGKK